MPSRPPEATVPVPEALESQRRRVREAERKGVDVTESKRHLVRALLSFRARRLEEMGAGLKESAQALAQEEGQHREERARRTLFALRERGASEEKLTLAEAALNQRDLPAAEAALSQALVKPRRPLRLLAAPTEAALFFESASFALATGAPSSDGFRLHSLRRGEASAPEALDAAMIRALRSLRPRPQVVHVALPREGHLVATVALPPMPESERGQALRWKMAKLCDFEPEGALLVSRQLGAGGQGGVLGLMAPKDVLARAARVVSRAGLPLGRVLPPAESLRAILPPVPRGESYGLLDIGRDTAALFVYVSPGLLLARDLGVGIDLWMKALETPISGARGSVRLSEVQSREVLGRFDVSGTDNLVLSDGTSVNDKDILSLLRPSLERLQDALSRSLDYASVQEGGAAVTRVYLSGQGASLPGLDRVLSSHAGIPVEILPLSGFPPSAGEVPSATDAVVLSLFASCRAECLDLSPPSAKTEAKLFRFAGAALVAGLLVAVGAAWMGCAAWSRSRDLQAPLARADRQLSRLEQDLGALDHHLREREVPPPLPVALHAELLRALSLVLPPDSVLAGMTVRASPDGRSWDLFLETSEGPDLAAALAGHPTFGRIQRAGAGAGTRRYHCPIDPGTLK